MNDRIELEEREKEPVKLATIIGGVSILLNLILGISKVVIGRMVNSSSLFSDGIHSTGDVLTTVIAVLSVWIAARKKNRKYNYGYERWASIACIVLAVILFMTAFEILFETGEGLISFLSGENETEAVKPFTTMWYVSISLSSASVLIKLIMFISMLYTAKKAHSPAMKEDAYHQIIDAVSSIAAIIALLGYSVFSSYNYLEPVFTLIIAIMVIYVGIETFSKATKELTDHAIDKKLLEQVEDNLKDIIPLEKVKLIRSRYFSEKFYLDIYILQDPNETLKESDALADRIKEKMFERFESCKDVYVFVQPDDEEHQKQQEIMR